MAFQHGWNTLEELRDFAIAAGSTLSQFEEAVKTVGGDPHDVANFLQRRALYVNNSTGRERRAS